MYVFVSEYTTLFTGWKSFEFRLDWRVFVVVISLSNDVSKCATSAFASATESEPCRLKWSIKS